MSTTLELMGLGMPPALAGRLGNTPATIAGVGTTQTGAALINVPVVVATAADASHVAFVLSNTLSTGRPVWVFNTSGQTISIFPPSGGTINGGSANAAQTIVTNKSAVFMLLTGEGVASETWGAVVSA